MTTDQNAIDRSPRHYCTYFDRNYLLRAVALFQSLRATAGDFILWALCFDDVSFSAVSAIADPQLVGIRLSDFESDDDELIRAKGNRTTIEYYFTCTPSLPLYIMRTYGVPAITYLDADLYFFQPPDVIFDQIGGASIAILPHRFPTSRPDLLKHGMYNVSFLMFRNNELGRNCLEWWRNRCLEWCYDRLEDGKFADQKYLDDWPSRFQDVHVIAHPGAGLAPWNWATGSVSWSAGEVTVDGFPLIFYHYHGLKVLSSCLYDPVAEGRFYGQMPLALRWRLYQPYIAALKRANHYLGETVPVAVNLGDVRRSPYSWKKLLRKIATGQLLPNYGIP